MLNNSSQRCLKPRENFKTLTDSIWDWNCKPNGGKGQAVPLRQESDSDEATVLGFEGELPAAGGRGTLYACANQVRIANRLAGATVMVYAVFRGTWIKFISRQCRRQSGAGRPFNCRPESNGHSIHWQGLQSRERPASKTVKTPSHRSLSSPSPRITGRCKFPISCRRPGRDQAEST